MSPLRIAFFTYSTKPRGSVIHTLELAEALHDLGQEVCIYALDKDGKGFDRPLSCDYCPIPAKPAPADTDVLIQQRIQEMADYLSQSDRQHEVYHAQDCLSANAIAQWRETVSTVRNSPNFPSFIRTVHHVEAFNSPYLQACQDRSIREPDLCLCVSQHWQQALWQHYRVNAPRVVNGVNLDRFSANRTGSESALKQRLGIHGSPVYLTVGGIEPRKNSIALLQAFMEILPDYPDAQLVIAGGATLFDYQAYRDEFFALAAQANVAIGRSLILPGVLSDQELPLLYRTADAFVFPSITEGWGLVILEAIASGLPVITSNQLPFTEFLNTEQAILIDPHSVKAIADAMRLITNPTLAANLVQHSQTCLSHYTWQRSAQLHLEYYHQLRHQPASLTQR
jgi:glycosyltransferase-like protein